MPTGKTRPLCPDQQSLTGRLPPGQLDAGRAASVLTQRTPKARIPESGNVRVQKGRLSGSRGGLRLPRGRRPEPYGLGLPGLLRTKSVFQNSSSSPGARRTQSDSPHVSGHVRNVPLRQQERPEKVPEWREGGYSASRSGPRGPVLAVGAGAALLSPSLGFRCRLCGGARVSPRLDAFTALTLGTKAARHTPSVQSQGQGRGTLGPSWGGRRPSWGPLHHRAGSRDTFSQSPRAHVTLGDVQGLHSHRPPAPRRASPTPDTCRSQPPIAAPSPAVRSPSPPWRPRNPGGQPAGPCARGKDTGPAESGRATSAPAAEAAPLGALPAEPRFNLRAERDLGAQTSARTPARPPSCSWGPEGPRPGHLAAHLPPPCPALQGDITPWGRATL